MDRLEIYATLQHAIEEIENVLMKENPSLEEMKQIANEALWTYSNKFGERMPPNCGQS